MADNTTLNPGTGGDVIATEEIAGAKLQRIKLALGAVDADDGDVSGSNALPVSGPLTNAQLRASAVPVDASGTVAAVEITDGANIADIISLGTPTTAGSIGMVVTGPITDAQLRAASVNIAGTVNVGNFPASQTISGTVNQGGTWYVQSINSATTVNSPNASNFLATVAGTVTATQSNASNFLSTVSGSVTALQTNASNFLATVSGTVTALSANASNFLSTISGTVTATQTNALNLKVDASSVNIPVVNPAGGKILVTPDANSAFNLSQIKGTTVLSSVAGAQDVTPHRHTGSTQLNPNYISGRINTSTTTTLVAATCYLSALHMTCVNQGTAWALKVQNGEATAKVLVPNFVLNANFTIGGTAFPNPISFSYPEPILCTTGINVVTVGGTPGSVDYFATYWQ